MSDETPQVAMSRDAFLGTDDRPPEKLPLPEELYGEGACFYGCTMTGTERSALEKKWSGGKAAANPRGFRWDILSQTLVDENGTLLFDPEKDIDAVMEKNAGTLEGLFEDVCEMNGLRKKDVKELEGNSEDGQ